MKKLSLRQLLVYLGIILFFVYGPYYNDIAVEDIKKEYADEDSRFIEIDGIQVHYKDEGKGFPIVLLHGTASSLHTWDAWTADLKQDYRVIRMDLPAFGITGPNRIRDYSIPSYTRFLEKFTAELHLDQFHLVGNSLGGNIAWNYAAEHPNQIDKLILIDASGLPTNKGQPFVFKMAKTPIINSIFLRVTPEFFIRKNLEQVYYEDSKITEDLVSRYHKMALREGNRQAFIDRAKIDFKLDAPSNYNKLKSLQTPTLLIWGAQDEWIPLENGKRMDSMMTNATLKVLQNSGHVPMEEHPKESLALLLRFLRDTI